MKRVLIIILVSFFVIANASAKNLKAYFSYCTFYSPEKGPYIETYLSVMGSSVAYKKNEKGKMQGNIEITLIFKQGDQIKNFKKYNLLSPELEDTLGDYLNFIDQQRIVLANGTYSFEIQLTDNYAKTSPFKSTQEIVISYPLDKISLSDIELIESFSKATGQTMLTKSGYDLVPFVTDYFPVSIPKISFYAEVYNTNKGLGENEKYLVNYFIESYETGSSINNYRGFARQTASQVNVVLSEFNIEKLPSGNYNLIIEIRNKNNEEVAKKKLFFQRSNPDVKIELGDITSVNTLNSFAKRISDKDTLFEYIRSLRPISTDMEISFADNQLKGADLELMQKFFLTFWQDRNIQNPEGEWLKYNQEVKKANKEYGTRITKGYNTDRGRIFLRYGTPNTLAERPHPPLAYPYEIWHYYKIKGQSNVKFVFYNPDMVTNNYTILHSNAIGEIRDYRWLLKLKNRNASMPNLDNNDTWDYYSNEAQELFNNPY
ncbi:MAG: GWxTD domain-containing protein [Candidatus Aminicenantes bacterium]|nr:MAG: GWxTD domain-containing protein [Candidatus Aminicenantes bacterium]